MRGRLLLPLLLLSTTTGCIEVFEGLWFTNSPVDEYDLQGDAQGEERDRDRHEVDAAQPCRR